MLLPSSEVSNGLAILGDVETSFQDHSRSTSSHFLHKGFQDTGLTRHYHWSSAIPRMNQFHYRQEDQFKEHCNARKLKELYEKKQYAALLDLALMLNYEAAFNCSKVHWALKESLELGMTIRREHCDMADEILRDVRDSQ